MDIRNL